MLTGPCTRGIGNRPAAPPETRQDGSQSSTSSGGAASPRRRVHQSFAAIGLADGSTAVKRLGAPKPALGGEQGSLPRPSGAAGTATHGCRGLRGACRRHLAVRTGPERARIWGNAAVARPRPPPIAGPAAPRTCSELRVPGARRKGASTTGRSTTITARSSTRLELGANSGADPRMTVLFVLSLEQADLL